MNTFSGSLFPAFKDGRFSYIKMGCTHSIPEQDVQTTIRTLTRYYSEKMQELHSKTMEACTASNTKLAEGIATLQADVTSIKNYIETPVSVHEEVEVEIEAKEEDENTEESVEEESEASNSGYESESEEEEEEKLETTVYGLSWLFKRD